MSAKEAVKVGRRGTIVIPATLRRLYDIQEGSLVICEQRDEGLLLRPAVAVPVESYTPQRKAEFLLSNAGDAEDYRQAVEEVRRMGLDPDEISHFRPPGA